MIHTFTALGRHIAVDVNSGAVHVLDQMCCDLLSLTDGPLGEECPRDFLDRLPQYDPEELREAWRELRELQDQGLLYSDDSYLDPQAAMALPKAAVVKALCLHVSHDCNLRCKYCFASTGDFGTGRKTMDFETARRAIDWVIAKSGKRRNIEVDFFGGEPLMAMDTVKRTVEYARSIEEKYDKCFRFTITTNGVLLNEENMEYINREMSNVVLSLDGRPEVNDNMRPTVNGKGSYDVIVPRFQKLAAMRGTRDYYVRGTFTRENLDFAADVMHLASLGFRNVSVEPASGALDDPYAIKAEDLERVEAEYENLARQLQGRGGEINFFHFNVDLKQGPCVIKRLRGCGAGCEYVAVTPDGDIYPCHQFVGREEYRMGSVYDGTFDMELSGKFAEQNIYTRPACRKCWARFYCSGGCSASNLIVNGDISISNEVACAMERKRLECAIALKATAAGMGEEPYTECNNTDCNHCNQADETA